MVFVPLCLFVPGVFRVLVEESSVPRRPAASLSIVQVSEGAIGHS